MRGLHAEVHSGNVTLVLPADTSATWEVETFSGNVTNEFGPGPEEKPASMVSGNGSNSPPAPAMPASTVDSFQRQREVQKTLIQAPAAPPAGESLERVRVPTLTRFFLRGVPGK